MLHTTDAAKTQGPAAQGASTAPLGGDAWIMPGEPTGHAWVAAAAPTIRILDQRASALLTARR